MIRSLKVFSASFISMAMVMLSGCIHDDFEQPEPWDYPQGTVLTISELRQLFSGTPVIFNADFYIHGVITMDDKSGNIYRSAFIEDHTAGINLRLVAPGGIYTGDSVRVYLKGTILDSYQRMLQLDNVNADRNINKIAVMKHVSPRVLDIPAILSGKYQGQLVALENVQFSVADTGQTFADKQGLRTMNRTLQDCDGNAIIVRTSGYAYFADSLVPAGSGSLVAVVSQFQQDIQLTIRRLDEVIMTGDRCAIPGDDYQLLTIAALRNNFREGNAVIPANSRIEGVVISDREHGNHPGQNLYLADESGRGIALRFTAFHHFDLGTRVRVVFSTATSMSTFMGLLQIDNLPAGSAFDLGPGTLPPPVTLTIAEASEQMDKYQSTLVRLDNVTISGGTTFTRNLTLTDASGQMLLYTYDWASFSGEPLPSGNLSITGILSMFTNPQLLIRNTGDISR